MYNASQYNKALYNASQYGPAVATYTHFIEAVVASFKLGLNGLFPASLATEWNASHGIYPNCTLEGFAADPGEADYDFYYTVLFCVREAKMRNAIRDATRVKAWFSAEGELQRPRMLWNNEREANQLVMAEDLIRERQRGPAGVWLWRYDITYEFRGMVA
jgi:hypothetical protein